MGLYSKLTITSPYVHSRVDSNTFTMGWATRVDLRPAPESALSPNQGLWIWPETFKHSCTIGKGRGEWARDVYAAQVVYVNCHLPLTSHYKHFLPASPIHVTVSNKQNSVHLLAPEQWPIRHFHCYDVRAITEQHPHIFVPSYCIALSATAVTVIVTLEQ